MVLSDGKGLVKKESKEIGRVSLGVYWGYICHTGVLPLIVAISILAFAAGFYVLAEWWVVSWASSEADSQDSATWTRVLVTFTCLGISSNVISVVALFVMLLLGSTRLHRRMLKTVLHSPLKFFHTNPTGRILNRFSKDMGMQDEVLPWVSVEVFTVSFLKLSFLEV